MRGLKKRVFLTVILLFLCLWTKAFAFDVKANYNQAARDLENIRKLKFKNQVQFVEKTRDEIRQFLHKALKEELPPQKLKAMDSFLKVFGFVPDDFKTFDFIWKLYTEQVAGLYDYKTKKMLLLKGGLDMQGMEQQQQMLKQFDSSLEHILLMHEMQHAIQDQYFDLTAMIKNAEGKNNDDYTNAVLALIEGDATAIMTYYMFYKMGGAEMLDLVDMSSMRDLMVNSPMNTDTQQFEKAPLFFKRSLLFPYIDGMIFVDSLKKRGGWALVNRAFSYPPQSTEQILHVDKYLMKDRPIGVSWSNLPKQYQGWELVDENTVGEMVIRILFEQFTPSADYKTAAAGWGGDRYRIYGRGKDLFLVWYTTWDREQDAREFMNHYIPLLTAKYPGLSWVKKVPQKAYLGSAGGNHCYVAVNGKDVLVMERIPPAMTQNLIKSAWVVNKKEL